ncbi:MAG: ABC transporter permease [Anaerolineae bacterium]
MIGDALTIMWKEWRELLLTRGNLRGGVVGMLVVLAAFGVVLPLEVGREWLRSPGVLVYWLWVPLLLVTGVVADSFAGERERHTLETLLASRLADSSILWGKVGTAVSYAWGLTMLSVLLGVVTVNVSSSGSLVFYQPVVFVVITLVTLIGAFLAASAGVLISLRAQSVRQAQQTLSVAIMALVFVPLLGSRLLSAATQARLGQLLSGGDVWGVVLAAAGVLLLVAIALMAVARARFRRARLILD